MNVSNPAVNLDLVLSTEDIYLFDKEGNIVYAIVFDTYQNAVFWYFATSAERTRVYSDILFRLPAELFQ